MPLWCLITNRLSLRFLQVYGVRISGAKGFRAGFINGLYAVVPHKPHCGYPQYQKEFDSDIWLYRSPSKGVWVVGNRQSRPDYHKDDPTGYCWTLTGGVVPSQTDKWFIRNDLVVMTYDAAQYQEQQVNNFVWGNEVGRAIKRIVHFLFPSTHPVIRIPIAGRGGQTIV